MHVEAMRREVSNVYMNDTWRKRVKKMPDSQIIAIYKKFQVGGELEKSVKKDQKQHYEQLTIDI